MEPVPLSHAKDLAGLAARINRSHEPFAADAACLAVGFAGRDAPAQVAFGIKPGKRRVFLL